jgi:hypothetical protein
MEQPYKLKMKIGQHEFEAEGPADVVQQQLQLFKDMIASAPASPAPYPQTVSMLPDRTIVPSTTNVNVESIESSIHKIMQFDDAERIVSLTIRPDSVEDAVLLILLGQKVMLSNESVTGGAIMEGITVTGLSVTRIDRLLEKLGSSGDVIVIGEHRGKRYRMTNSGVNRAKEIAEKWLVMVG